MAEQRTDDNMKTNESLVVECSGELMSTRLTLPFADVQQLLRNKYDDDIIFSDQWDPYGRNSDGKHLEKMLVWLTGQESKEDHAERPVAKIIRLKPMVAA